MSKFVRLRLKALTFVTTERDIERGPQEQTLVVEAQVFDKMVAWAEARGWKAPGRSLKCRHMPRVAVKDFVLCLREAIGAETAAAAGPRGRVSVEGSMQTFFAVRANRTQLAKVLTLLAGGGELVVEDEPDAPVDDGRPRRRVEGSGRAATRRSL